MSTTTDYTDFSDYTKRKNKRENFPHKERTYQIIGAAMEVHRELGPGFLEKVYENALIIELTEARGMPIEVQKSIPLFYKGKRIGEHILDILVAGNVILEIKAVKELAPIHEAQLLSYLKATNCKVGLLLNFSEQSLKYKRLVI
ncbi:MAG: GxxExxY protein [Halobacteriota archaeon]